METTTANPLLLTEELEVPTFRELELAIEFTGREYGRIAEKEAQAWADLNDAEDTGSTSRSELDQMFEFAEILEAARIRAGYEWQAAKAARLAKVN
jgi:hypothetical protein